jgi:hypothetical protein
MKMKGAEFIKYLQWPKKSGKLRVLLTFLIMSEISRQNEHLAQNTLADKIRDAIATTDAAKLQLLKESLIGSDATTVLPPKYKWWKSDYPVYLRKDAGSKHDVNGIREGAKLTILDVAKETTDTKRGQGTNDSHIWYQVQVENQTDLYTKAYGNTNIGWVSAEFIHADTSHTDNMDFDPIPVPPEPVPEPVPVPPVVPPVVPPKPPVVPPVVPPKPPVVPTVAPKVWTTESNPYFSRADEDKVNVDVDADDIEKGVIEFNDISEIKASVLESIRSIDKDNTLQPLFDSFSKKANTYPLLWSIILAESQIHGEDKNGLGTNIWRWIQRDPVYKSWVEWQIKTLQTEYQSLLSELTQAIASKDAAKIKTSLTKLNDHLSPTKNQLLMDNLANGLSEAKWSDEVLHGNWWTDEGLSVRQMQDWYKLFEQGDVASVYQFTSDKLEARDILTGMLVQSAKLDFRQWASFETIVDMGKGAMTEKALNTLLWNSFEFMWEKFDMPRSVWRGLIWTGLFKDSYAESIQRMMKKTNEQWLSREDTINYIKQMFMAEIVLQKEDAIMQKFSEKAQSGKSEDFQKLEMAEQFFKNKSLWTEFVDNWQMYSLKAATVYATMGTWAWFAGGLAEGLAARWATTGLGRLGLSLQNGPIVSRAYQLWTIQTSLAAGTAISQWDLGVFTDQMLSPKYWLEWTVLLGAFAWLQTGLNTMWIRVSSGMVASRAFTLPRDIIAGMGVIGVNEVVFDGEFTLEEVVNTILFAAAANMTAPKISKGGDWKIKIVDIVPKTETSQALKGRETLLHENFPNTPIKLADWTNITAGKFNNKETVFTVEKPGKQPKTVKVWELANELTIPQRRELYSNTLVKKIRELNNQRNELVAKRNKLSDKQDKDQNNYGLHEQIKETQAQIVKLETTMKDLYKRANDSKLIDEALNGIKNWPEAVSPNTPIANNAQSEVLNTKLAGLEKQYKTLKESGREWQRDRQELIRLNDEINAVKNQIAQQKPTVKEEAVAAPKEKFTTAEKATDHGKMRELEWKISGFDTQIAAAERLANKTTKTRELMRLNGEKTVLVKELNDIRTKYQIPTYDRAPTLATNTTLGEFTAGVEKSIVPKVEKTEA